MALDTLPAEIIKRIASHLTCVSALSFSSINHRFHTLVYDHLVFASILLNQPIHLYQGPISSTDFKRPWTSSLSSSSVFPDSDGAQKWARFALASQEATELITRQSLTSESSLLNGDTFSVVKNNDTWQKLIVYAPQLLALHHPCLSSMDSLIAVISLLPQDPAPGSTYAEAPASWSIYEPSFGDVMAPPPIPPPQSLSKDQAYVLDFTLTLLALQHGISSLLSRSTPGGIDILMTAMKRRLLAHTSDAIKTHNGPHGPFMSVFICSLVARLRQRQQRGKVPPIVWPPVALNIPFVEFMDLPLPYTEKSLEEGDDGANVDWEKGSSFKTCHIAKTCTAEFLTTGTWTAYYSLSMDLESVTYSPRFQPPTLDIQFSIIPAPSTSPPISESSLPFASPSSHFSPSFSPTSSEYNLTATGSDHELFATGSEYGGQLTAIGVMTRDGRMEMKETNYIGKTYYWHLEMVPAGLFGTWGNEMGGSRPRGYMWLFKTAWSAKIES